MKIIQSILAFAALSACAPSTSNVKALPQGFVDAAIDAAFAEQIAEECRSLRYNQAREDKVLEAHAAQLANAGYTPRDLFVASAQMRRDPALTAKALRMIQERNIDPSSEASWCAAGKREKVRGTNIGRYLI